MRIIANILPSINLSARLSCNTSNQRYSSLVRVVPRNYYLACRNLAGGRICKSNAIGKKSITEYIGPFKKTGRCSSLTALNCISKNSHNVFLIPLDWLRANEHSMRSTITSIFSNTQKIGKFSPALKNVKIYRKKETKYLKTAPQSDQKMNLNESQLVKYKNVINTFAANRDYLGVLADVLNKSFKQIFGIGTHAQLIKLVKKENNSNLSISISPFKNQNMPFSEIKGFLTKAIPMALAKKSFSTSTSALMIKNFSEGKSFDIQTLITQTKSSLPNSVDLNVKRNSSSSSSRCKSNPNYDFPYLSKIFGTEALLMRSDAYNQALIEASKRRAALEECQSVSLKLTNDEFSRPQISLKESSAPKINTQYTLKPEPKPFMPSPAPAIPKKQADSGCKKDDPCKPVECPDPCKTELEKLENLKNESKKKKKNKMPTGCVNPKCKKDNKCNKPPKSPCKKASNEIKIPIGEVEELSKSDTPMQQIALKSKRPSNQERIGDVIKTSDECRCSKCNKGNKNKGKSSDKAKPKKKQDICKEEKKEYKPKCNPDPCKQDKPCGGDKKAMKNPTNKDEKKAQPCKKKDSGDKKGDSCGKKKDPCGKKEDPCGKKKDPCGKKEDPCGKKKDPCGKKEDPCGKKKDPCGKKEDPCGKKKDPCAKKEDPCGKKKDPCGKKEDPCGKKKDPCGKKEDPCGKKKDPCAKKEDPCGKKKDPCGKKEDPCKKKSSSPCKPKKSASSSSGCGGQQKKSTKPNCKKNFSTNTTVSKPSCDVMVKGTLANLPTLNYWNLYSFGFMRHFSSKKKKSEEDLGNFSRCKTVQTRIPAQRKNAYNPHPKDGLRQCYPTYDMECKKLCKDPRQTDCRKYAFLKDTEDKKRKNKK